MIDKDFFETQSAKLRLDAEQQLMAKAQHNALMAATERIKMLETEIVRLQSELANALTPKAVERIEVPVEQTICEIQIRRLQEISLQRDLTLNETKQLDILIKNLYLAKGKSTVVMGSSRRVEDMSDADLVSLAKLPAPSDAK